MKLFEESLLHLIPTVLLYLMSSFVQASRLEYINVLYITFQYMGLEVLNMQDIELFKDYMENSMEQMSQLVQ
jgi:diacylglycerol kinase